MTGDTPISTLAFVGPKYEQLLQHLGITTVRDLLYHIPVRYQDLSKITLIEALAADELQVIEARVWEIKKVRMKGGRVMITAQVGDDTGSLSLTWFNQPFIEKTLRPGESYRFAGEVEQKFGRLQMTNPLHELASRPMVHTGRLVPVYPQTAGVSSKWLRARLAPLLEKLDALVPEFLPADLLRRHQLLPLATALRQLHAPETLEQAQAAKQRLGFDELLLLQLTALQRKQAWHETGQAPQLTLQPSQRDTMLQHLPFTLTGAQQRALHDIEKNLAQSQPMNRLLEGDVGSGKTVVAALAAHIAHHHHYQTAIMAPTAVLAQQHYLTFRRLLELFGVSVSLRTSQVKGEVADVTIGTHALLSEGVAFPRLGLVIIDEQHRFGVEQRATLMAKAGHAVHLLTMTATPIPRTLALTIYGDLDLTIIDELPQGRLPIKTHIVPDRKRQDCYGFLRQAVARGEQIYVVCPLIEESDSLESVRSATSEYERLRRDVFTTERVALLHGRMKPHEKDQVLADFNDHQYDVLVTTPVVEVGIDVPNATIMVIEAAERFGLAQLHQLRGRVGRGQVQSYCFLFSDVGDPREVARLRHLEQETQGIRLAELDLQTRGPGEVYGVRQSGIPTLKAASLFDHELIEASRQEAERLLQTGQLATLPALQQQLLVSQRHVELN